MYELREALFIEEAYLTYCTTLLYHKVLVNNKTEQDTEQDTTYRYDQRSRMPTPVALLFEILIKGVHRDLLKLKHVHALRTTGLINHNVIIIIFISINIHTEMDDKCSSYIVEALLCQQCLKTCSAVVLKFYIYIHVYYWKFNANINKLIKILGYCARFFEK